MSVGFGRVYYPTATSFNSAAVDMDMMAGERTVCNRIDSKGLRKIR